MTRTTLWSAFVAVLLLPAIAEATFLSSGSSRRIPLDPRVGVEEPAGQRLTALSYSVDSNGSLFLYRTFERKVGHLGVGVTELGQAGLKDGEQAYTGLRVSSIDKEGPAYAAGVRAGDVLLTVDDTQLSNPNQFPILIKLHSLEKPARMRVQRGHEKFDVSVQLEERDEGTTDIDRITLATFDDHHTGTLFGELTADVSPYFFDGGGTGIVVMDIKPGSPAFYSDLRRGDIIMALGEVPVARAAALDELLAESIGREPVLMVKRGKQHYTIPIDPEPALSEGFHFQIPIVIDVEKRMQRTDFELGLGLVLDYDRRSTVNEVDEHEERHEFGMILNLIHFESTPARRQIRLLWFIKLGWRR